MRGGKVEHSKLTARLIALHKVVARRLENPIARYFNPASVLQYFERWAPVRDALKAAYSDLLAEKTVIATFSGDSTARGSDCPISRRKPTGRKVAGSGLHSWCLRIPGTHATILCGLS